MNDFILHKIIKFLVVIVGLLYKIISFLLKNEYVLQKKKKKWRISRKTLVFHTFKHASTMISLGFGASHPYSSLQAR